MIALYGFSPMEGAQKLLQANFLFLYRLVYFLSNISLLSDCRPDDYLNELFLNAAKVQD